MTNEIMVIGGL